jgi:hypothetical protein
MKLGRLGAVGSGWQAVGVVSIATVLRFLQNGGNVLSTVKYFSFKERLCYLVFVKRHLNAGLADCHVLQYSI